MARLTYTILVLQNSVRFNIHAEYNERPSFPDEKIMDVGYVRVSVRDQTVALQVNALKQAGCADVFTEVVSDAVTERPQAGRARDHCSSKTDSLSLNFLGERLNTRS